MWWLLFETVLAVLGMTALVTGRFPWTRKRVVEGAFGRIIGCLLLLPVIVGTLGAVAAQLVIETPALREFRGPTADEVRDVWWARQGIHITVATIAIGLALLIAAKKARPSRQGGTP